MEGDCFVSVGMLSQCFAPRYENNFWPFLTFSLKSSNQQLYFEDDKSCQKSFMQKDYISTIEQAL